jgi:hypothetical protein
MRARVCACASLYIITKLSTKSIGKRCSKIIVAICESACHISIIESATERETQMKTFCVTVERNVIFANDVYINASDPQEAMQILQAKIDSGDIGWYDVTSWGEAYHYSVEKQIPSSEDFEIIEAFEV